MSAAQIYIASAGSGKTFIIVKEYLKILFEKANYGYFHAFRNILAITFTNKATNEMKSRVVDELTVIAEGEASDMLQVLKAELNHINNFEELAGKLLVNLLHDYSNFNIQTIDSFFQNVVRAFARELKLPVNFELILDADDAFEFAVDELLEQIGQNSILTEWLSEYATSRLQNNKGWNFRHQLLTLAKQVHYRSSDVEFKTDQEFFKTLRKELQVKTKQFEDKVSRFAREALDQIEENEADTLVQSNFKKFLIKVVTKKGRLTDSKDITDSTKKFLSGEKPIYKKITKKNQSIYDQITVTDFEQIIERLNTHVIDNWPSYLIDFSIGRNIYALGVIGNINELLKTYRTDKNALFLYDTAKLIEGFISTGDASFIFEKIGSKIHYLFIDEFQDTSHLQWYNLMPIAQHILGSTEKGLHVMLVGDAKQSIYRWRGGDYQLLTSKAQKSLQPFETEELHLLSNYRSSPEIVAFNNQYFELVKEIIQSFPQNDITEEYKEAYDQHQQKQIKGHPVGFVSVKIHPKSTGKAWHSDALDDLIKNIQSLKDHGYSLSDMAILVRKRDEGIIVSRYLQDHNIEVISNETLLLKHDKDIKLIIAAFNFIADPNVPLHYTNLVWQLSKREDGQDLTEEVIFSDFREMNLLKKWYPKLTDDLNTLTNQSSYSLLGYLQELFLIDGTKNIYVGYLKQLVYEFYKKESIGLGDFLEWWEEENDSLSVKVEGGQDKINVLTIHKSKGLEFKAVLMPFCQWEFYRKSHETLLWLKNDNVYDGLTIPLNATAVLKETAFADEYFHERKMVWMDNINMMYVAYTRAKDVLMISSPYEIPKGEIPNSPAKLNTTLLLQLGIECTENEVGFLVKGTLEKAASESASVQTTSKGVKIDQSAYYDNTPILNSTFENQHIRIGNLVHKTLHLLGTNKFELAFEKAKSYDSYNDLEIEMATQHLKTIKDQTAFGQWVDSAVQIWDEQALWFEEQLLRPDKILRLPDKYIIVDYKTGEQLPVHKKKVGTYINAMQTIAGNLPVEGYLLYTETGSLLKV